MDEAQVVQDQVDAYNARDLERFLSFYHPDVVMEDATGNVMAQGQEALRGAYGPMFAQSPDLHVEIPRRIHVGTWVIDEEEASGLHAEGFPEEIHAAVLYQVVDGKIARVRLLM